MNSLRVLYTDTVIGRLGVAECGGRIVRVLLPGETTEGLLDDNNTLLQETLSQLCDYLDGVRRTFSLPFEPEGTEFCRRVWAEMGVIPFGQVMTYGTLAARLGTSPRAVGTACGKNPIPLLIPCHRVVGARGLTGFRGGLNLKRFLLALEERQLDSHNP